MAAEMKCAICGTTVDVVRRNSGLETCQQCHAVATAGIRYSEPPPKRAAATPITDTRQESHVVYTGAMQLARVAGCFFGFMVMVSLPLAKPGGADPLLAIGAFIACLILLQLVGIRAELRRMLVRDQKPTKDD